MGLNMDVKCFFGTIVNVLKRSGLLKAGLEELVIKEIKKNQCRQISLKNNAKVRILLRKKCTKGFTLIELIIIISIIGILFAIATLAYSRYVKKAKEEVCKVNCEQVERAYEAYLVLENIENSGVVFEEFMKEYGINLCPEHGIVTYVDGSVKCSVHTKDESEDDEVPFL